MEPLSLALALSLSLSPSPPLPLSNLRPPALTELDDMVPRLSQVFTADSMQRVACRAPRGQPPPEVWWERAGQRVPSEGRVYQDGLDLVFSPTEQGDSGAYTCVAQNKAGRKTQEVTFTVASRSHTHTRTHAEASKHAHTRTKYPH